MTYADSATTSINDNNLMKAESSNNAEDMNPILKYSTSTIRNPYATTPPPVQPLPPTQH